MKQIILFTVIGALLMGVFALNRQIEDRRLQQELSILQAEKLVLLKDGMAAAELEKKYTATADVAAFTEDLYGCARQTGIRDHEVITSRQNAEQQVSRGRSRKQTTDLKTHRLQVNLSGSFRQIAEYIDQTQSLSSYKKITRLEIIPGERTLGVTAIIDLYSFEAPHVR